MCIDNDSQNFKAAEKKLSVLHGLPLKIARRAADMRGFHFGQIEPHPDGQGSCGKFVLHIQCSWRLEGPQGIVTGHRDLWEPKEEDGWEEDWNYQEYENLQDWKLTELIGNDDSEMGSPINISEKLIVESVEIKCFGDLIIKLSGGYQISTFLNHTRGESWRFFSLSTDDHVCMECDEGVPCVFF